MKERPPELTPYTVWLMYMSCSFKGHSTIVDQESLDGELTRFRCRTCEINILPEDIER